MGRIYYTVVDKDNKILKKSATPGAPPIAFDFRYGDDMPCFCYIIKNPGLPEDAAKIVISRKPENVAASPEVIKQWIAQVNAWGFPCSYEGMGYEPLGISTDNHIWIVPIKDEANVYYNKKSHLAPVLNFIRYCFDDGSRDLPNKFVELTKKFPEEDPWILMQFAHLWRSPHADNNLRNSTGQPESFVSFDEYKKRAEAFKTDIYSNELIEVSSLLRGKVRKGLAQIKDEEIMFKHLKNDKTTVFVVGSSTGYANWIPNATLVKTMEEAEVVLFTGGEDINPALYKDSVNRTTSFNESRDAREVEAYKKARELNKKMLGICRGHQLFCAMAGGKLIQHQKNPSFVHEVHSEKYGTFLTTSLHHQAAYPFDMDPFHYKIIAHAKGHSPYHLDGNDNELSPKVEAEIIYYKNINALGIQGHPEMMYGDPKMEKSLDIMKTIYNDFLTNKL